MNDGSRRSELLIRRVAAKLIDLALAWALSYLFLPGVLLAIVTLAAGDAFHHGQSLGKRALHLRVREGAGEGAPCSFRASLYRNLPFLLLPLFVAAGVLGWILLAVVFLPALVVETWLMAVDPAGMRIGDRLAGTRVVEVRS